MGLIDYVVPPGTALAAALDRAVGLAAAAPAPIAMTKQWLGQGLDDALAWERDTQAALYQTADHRKGRDAFLAKRPPIFSGG